MKTNGSKPIHVKALTDRVCESCGRDVRFVGLESHAREPGLDLCTYECPTCGNVQVESVARAQDRTHERRRLRAQGAR